METEFTAENLENVEHSSSEDGGSSSATEGENVQNETLVPYFFSFVACPKLYCFLDMVLTRYKTSNSLNK